MKKAQAGAQICEAMVCEATDEGAVTSVRDDCDLINLRYINLVTNRVQSGVVPGLSLIIYTGLG